MAFKSDNKDVLLYAGYDANEALDWALEYRDNSKVEREDNLYFVHMNTVPSMLAYIVRKIDPLWQATCMRALLCAQRGNADRQCLLPLTFGYAPAHIILDGHGLTIPDA